MIFLLITVNIFLFIIYYKLYKSNENPGSYTLIGFMVCEIVFLLGILNYGQNLNNFGKVYLEYIFLFLVMTLIIENIYKKSRNVPKTSHLYIYDYKKLNNYINVVIGLSFLGIFFSVIINIQTYGLVGTFNLSNLNQVRNGVMSGELIFPLIIRLLRYMIFVMAFSLGIFKNNIRFYKVKIIFLIIFILLYDITQFSKSAIIYGTVVFFLSYIKSYKLFNQHMNYKVIIKYFMTFVVFLILVFYVQTIRVTGDFSFDNMKNSETTESVYLYFTSSLPAFDKFMEVNSTYYDFQFGSKFLNGIIRTHVGADEPIIMNGIVTNIYTGFLDFYLDFSYFGFIIYPIMLSLISNVCYFELYRRRKIKLLPILVFVELSLITLPIFSVTRFAFFFFVLLISYVLIHLLKRKKIIEYI